jgi:hypothetical protein
MFVGVFHGTSISALITGGSRCSIPLSGFGCEFGRGLIFLISNDWVGGLPNGLFLCCLSFSFGLLGLGLRKRDGVELASLSLGKCLRE